jgi:outer membrane protein
MRNKLTNFSLLILTVALYSIPYTAVAAEIAPLEQQGLFELYRLAKAKDPDVARAVAHLESGQADKEIAVAALLPRVSANGSVREFWTRVIDYNPPLIKGKYTGYSYGAGTTIPIFNMPTYYQVFAASSGIKSSEIALQGAKQTLMVNLVDAYIRSIKSKADIALYRDELNRVAKVLQQTEAFLEAGTGDIIAVYEAKARIDSAAADLVKTEGLYRLAQQNLALLTGVPVISVKDIVLDKPSGPNPEDPEWWLDTMRKRNPALLQAKEDMAQAEENRKGAKAGHLPTIQANGGYTADKGSTFLPKVETDQWYVGIGMTLPIYSGGETEARTRRALAGEMERKAMFNYAEDQATKKLKEAYLNLSYNKSLVEAYKRKQDSAELQLKAVQTGHDIDTRTSIELLNAEQSYALSRRDYTASMYDNVQRQLELKAAAGVLTEEELAQLSGVAKTAVQ